MSVVQVDSVVWRSGVDAMVRLARYLSAAAVITACSGWHPPGRADLAVVIAHELGHAADLEHTDRGVMAAYYEPTLPTTGDWQATARGVTCVAWRVPTDMEPAFFEAADAWCESSSEYCPNINAESDCVIVWAEMDPEYLGSCSRDRTRIEINKVLLPDGE